MWVRVVALALCLLACGSAEEPQDTGPVEFECPYGCSLDSSVMVGGDLWFAVHGLRPGVRHSVRSLAPEVMTASTGKERVIASPFPCLVPHCASEPQVRVSARSPGEARILIENDRGVRAELTLRAAVETRLSLTVWHSLDDGDSLEPTPSAGTPYELSTGELVVVTARAVEADGERLLGDGVTYVATVPTVLLLDSDLFLTAGERGLADLVASTASSEYRFRFAVVAPRESPPEALLREPPWGTRPAP
jgi:hypothetical protein